MNKQKANELVSCRLTQHLEGVRQGWLGVWDAIVSAVTRNKRYSLAVPYEVSFLARGEATVRIAKLKISNSTDFEPKVECSNEKDINGSFQSRVYKWFVSCFGPKLGTEIERSHRFLEEALELVQVIGCSREEAHNLVDYTYNRYIGELDQEIGGVMTTLAVLCEITNKDMQKWRFIIVCQR